MCLSMYICGMFACGGEKWKCVEIVSHCYTVTNPAGKQCLKYADNIV